jgi:hypothetical protein
MIIRPITSPIAGEHLAGVAPPLKPDVGGVWHRRLNLFTGRALSDVALTTEQQGRGGRLATAGQRLSPGVVSGLELALEEERRADQAIHLYHLGSGLGVAASGEDVFVSREVRVEVGEVPVYAPAALAFGAGGGPPPGTTPPPAGTTPDVRRLWPPLNDLIAAKAQLPPVGVLVLQPVVLEAVGVRALADPCEQDPANYAFEDWQLVDGCRLVWYAWPTDWLPLPAPGERWRNRLAYAVFDANRQMGCEDLFPWEELGVPLGVVAFDTSWTPLFVDRFTAVRSGGRPRTRTLPLEGVGTTFLFQARVQQFIEQVASVDLRSVKIGDLAAQFRYLPPVGVLPKTAIAPRTGENRFFPGTYTIDAVPVPLEQLSVVLQESSPLAPFDLFTPDAVRVLVPVPQMWYEPGLLRVEVVGPEFKAAIDQFSTRRGKWLKRRSDVRGKAAVLSQAIAGKAPDYPSPDPEAVEPEAEAEDPLDPADDLLKEPEADYGTTVHGTTRTATEFDDLRRQLRDRTPLRHQTAAAFTDPLPPSFPPPELADRLSYDPAAKQLVYVGRMPPETRDLLSNGFPALRGPVARLFARSQSDDVSRLDELGLQRLIEFLTAKVAAANDVIDANFMRVQSDIYRIRQIMLGSEAATRLATSPALASIAQGNSAFATQQQLTAFLKETKLQSAPTGGGAAGPGAAAANPGGVAVPPPANAMAFVAARAVMAADAHVAGGAASTPRAATTARLATTAAAAASFRNGGGAAGNGSAAATAVGRLTGAQLVHAATGLSALNIPRIPSPEDVTQEQPIVGKALNFRNLSVAERLQEPPATEAKSFTVATKYTVITQLADVGINVDDIEVPGFYAYDEHGTLLTDDVADPRNSKATIKVPRETTHTFGAIRESNLAREILFDHHDLDPGNGDESAFFAAGVRAADHSVATLRLVEGRVQAYQDAISVCQRTLSSLQNQYAAATGRLSVIGDHLAEARQEVSVARALLADETARVHAVNERRDRVVAEHLDFLAFQRTRSADLLVGIPVRSLTPGLVDAPVPACLAHDVAVPPELHTMIDMMRHVPVKWFAQVPRVLDRLNRLDILQYTFQTAKLRATTQPAGLLLAAGDGDATALGRAVAGVLGAQHQVVAQYQAQRAQLDLGALVGLSWTQVRDHAQESLSLGDLIDGGHGRSDVAQLAAQELETITHVAACLYERFGAVLPSIRLDWTERLGQYEAPANLRNLASLPRWGEIAFLERQEMQMLVDWLFGRVDPATPGALSLVNDLVRLCLLLASHAPVDRIIAGEVHRDTPLHLGGRVDVAVDVTKVHVGMIVHMYSGTDVVAHGVVEDLGGGIAAARVLQSLQPGANLARGARVQFVEPGQAARQGPGVALTRTAAHAPMS